MQSSETRAVVQRFLEARAANNRADLVELLADDAEWYPPASAGFGPFQGRDTVADALTGGAAGRLFDQATIRRTVHRLIVEDDVAVALQQLNATTRKGATYENQYCWVYSCRDGRIARLDEYVDTLHAALVLGTASLTRR